LTHAPISASVKPMLIQIAVLVLASAVAVVLLALAWLITKIGREAPEALDRILYRNTPRPGAIDDPITTAGLDDSLCHYPDACACPGCAMDAT